MKRRIKHDSWLEVDTRGWRWVRGDWPSSGEGQRTRSRVEGPVRPCLSSLKAHLPYWVLYYKLSVSVHQRTMIFCEEGTSWGRLSIAVFLHQDLSWGAQPQVLLMVSGSWPLSRALSVSCPCFSALIWHDPEHLPQMWGEDFTSVTQCLENALEWQPRSGQWWLPRPRFSASPGTWVTKSQGGGYAPSRHPQLHPVRTGALSQSWPGIPPKPVPPDPAPTVSSLLLSCDATPTVWEGQLEDSDNGLEDHGKRCRPGQSATGLGRCNWKWKAATCSTVKTSIVPHDVLQSNGLRLFLFFKNLVVLGQPLASLWALSAYPPLPGHPSAVPGTPPRGWPELDQAWVTVTPLEKNITSDYTIYFLFMCQ